MAFGMAPTVAMFTGKASDILKSKHVLLIAHCDVAPNSVPGELERHDVI